MTNNEGKVPCKLLGEDGNAFAIIGRVTRALRENGQADRIADFQEEATSGDYENLIATAMKYTYDPDFESDFNEDPCENCTEASGCEGCEFLREDE